ncbi:hypothetical protein EJF36_09740 [Bacillus sp. HMF5848]|uniref:hypothetical protein n=1 Tax=Bacillus sp. HMF5848 TaxID=2495421 RepID=UPI000F79673B|nr:hypothetical protein [Bacillus sp. HMF5848]RSK27136.1 hypothetical protein EJF36_09740 [Bacillus sp. HMF5848]
MTYHKDKQFAYQEAQKGVKEAIDVYESLVINDPGYGAELKDLKNEINEAYAQIENALEVASDTQRNQLRQMQQDIQSIVSQVNQ